MNSPGRTTCPSKRVLIADDSQGSRELLRYILQRIGCEVVEAADGKDALHQALVSVPDLVILDINMPGLNGYEIAIELRSHPALRRTPIVALSAEAFARHSRMAEDAGFSMLLVKPVVPAQLRRCVSCLLGQALESQSL